MKRGHLSAHGGSRGLGNGGPTVRILNSDPAPWNPGRRGSTMPPLFTFPFMLLTLSLLKVFSGPSLGPAGPAVRDTFRSDLE